MILNGKTTELMSDQKSVCIKEYKEKLKNLNTYKKAIMKRNYNYKGFKALYLIMTRVLTVDYHYVVDYLEEKTTYYILFNRVRRELFKNIIKYPKERDMFLKMIKELKTEEKDYILIYGIKHHLKQDFTKECLGYDIDKFDQFDTLMKKLYLKGYL